MWYKEPRMTRRGTVAALLAIIVVQLVCGMAFATVCTESCPDDGPGSSCPPVCSLCTSCTHAQQAVVRNTVTPVALAVTAHVFHVTAIPVPSLLSRDIFHVPLPG
jgi:hypothetical protein